jgi:hypothetical protein
MVTMHSVQSEPRAGIRYLLTACVPNFEITQSHRSLLITTVSTTIPNKNISQTTVRGKL